MNSERKKSELSFHFYRTSSNFNEENLSKISNNSIIITMKSEAQLKKVFFCERIEKKKLDNGDRSISAFFLEK